MGEEAARLFFESIEKGRGFNKRVMLPIDLVVRASSVKT
jgi:DNA-binding LacI/PurR family transcriptional regulator